MKSIVKKAREIVTQLYERNMVSWNDLDREVVFAIQALIAEVQRMEAVAQPEQEPVAWEQFYPDIGKPQIEFAPVKMVAYNCTCGKTIKFESVHGVVAPQRTWVGLTDEDFQPMVQKAMVYYGCKPEHSTLTSGAGFYALVRAIEAKIKDKNL